MYSLSLPIYRFILFLTGCMCPCSMQNQRLFNSSEELYQRIQELRKILKVEKNSTNASLRKKISAPDSRPSSAGIGTIFGYGVIIGLVTLLVISDARILYRQLRFGTNWRPNRFCRISIKLKKRILHYLTFSETICLSFGTLHSTFKIFGILPFVKL